MTHKPTHDWWDAKPIPAPRKSQHEELTEVLLKVKAEDELRLINAAKDPAVVARSQSPMRRRMIEDAAKRRNWVESDREWELLEPERKQMYMRIAASSLEGADTKLAMKLAVGRETKPWFDLSGTVRQRYQKEAREKIEDDFERSLPFQCPYCGSKEGTIHLDIHTADKACRSCHKEV